MRARAITPTKKTLELGKKHPHPARVASYVKDAGTVWRAPEKFPANGSLLGARPSRRASHVQEANLDILCRFSRGRLPSVLDRAAETPLPAGLAHPPSGGRLVGPPPGGLAIGVPTPRGAQSAPGEDTPSVAREMARHAVLRTRSGRSSMQDARASSRPLIGTSDKDLSLCRRTGNFTMSCCEMRLKYQIQLFCLPARVKLRPRCPPTRISFSYYAVVVHQISTRSTAASWWCNTP